MLVRQSTSIKLDVEAKQQAQIIFNKLGITMGDAFNLFLHQINLHNGLPFEVKIPNKKTQKVIKEARSGKNISDFSTDELLNAN